MTAVLPLQQHPTLLRTFASILAEGVADAKPCDNTEEVFKTLTGGIYVGGVLALFQHDGNGCGPIFVPKVDPTAKVDRNMPLGIFPRPLARGTPQALLRMPMLCSQEAMALLLTSTSPQQFCDTWLRVAQCGPVVGSVLVAVPTTPTHTPEQLDTYTANTLLLAAALAPLVLQQAEGRLLQATIACGALGSAPPAGVTYLPGQGFVAPASCDDGNTGLVAEQLMHMLSRTPEPVGEDDVDSSCGSLDSVNAPPAKDDDEGQAGPSNKRQRCAEDAQSVARDWWDDSDEDDCGGPSSHSMSMRVRQRSDAPKNDGSPSTSEGASSCGANGEDNGKRCTVAADGLRYADPVMEGRFLVFMLRDMATVKRFMLLCFFTVLAAVGKQLCNNVAALEGWEARVFVLLSLLQIGLVLVLHSLPVWSARWAALVEQVTAMLYLLLGVPNVLLQTRMWLAIMSGQMIMYSTMPLLALHTLCDNGCMLRLLRHTWATYVGACKRGAMVSCVCAVVVTDPTVRWWAVPVAAAIAQLASCVSGMSAALEGAQRTRFQHALRVWAQQLSTMH